MMIDPEHILTVSAFVVGSITLALSWILLVLTLAKAIVQLWLDLVGGYVGRPPKLGNVVHLISVLPAELRRESPLQTRRGYFRELAPAYCQNWAAG
jgi:hypothetical protein